MCIGTISSCYLGLQIIGWLVSLFFRSFLRACDKILLIEFCAQGTAPRRHPDFTGSGFEGVWVRDFLATLHFCNDDRVRPSLAIILRERQRQLTAIIAYRYGRPHVVSTH